MPKWRQYRALRPWFFWDSQAPTPYPPEIRTDSLFQVVTPKSRRIGSLVTFVALVPVAGAHLQQVCYLPPLWMPLLSEHSWCELPRSAGQGRQYLTARQRHKGVRICSPVRHTHTHAGAHMHEAAVGILCHYTGMERERVDSQCRQG